MDKPSLWTRKPTVRSVFDATLIESQVEPAGYTTPPSGALEPQRKPGRDLSRLCLNTGPASQQRFWHPSSSSSKRSPSSWRSEAFAAGDPASAARGGAGLCLGGFFCVLGAAFGPVG